MTSLKQRLAALEKTRMARRLTKMTALVMIHHGECTPQQQAEIDEAEQAGRPVLVIHAPKPEYAPGADEIIIVGS